jgi:hypothetical protein
VARRARPARSYDPRVSLRRVILACAGLLVLVLLVVVAPVVRLALDEGAVPASSDIPPLPAGVTAGHEEVTCGSGGCYLRLRLSKPGAGSAEEIAGNLGVREQKCQVRSLVDRRRVCTYVDAVGKDVFLSVQFDRSSSL